ncbi:unnamed protein product [Durusdinium trenchii]|uniref:Uncharacterized protein n=1 Tax=Durusdinium trenchii TaxID=1381693 RepID=A0ABP0MXN3_9DINO
MWEMSDCLSCSTQRSKGLDSSAASAQPLGLLGLAASDCSMFSKPMTGLPQCATMCLRKASKSLPLLPGSGSPFLLNHLDMSNPWNKGFGLSFSGDFLDKTRRKNKNQKSSCLDLGRLQSSSLEECTAKCFAKGY